MCATEAIQHRCPKCAKALAGEAPHCAGCGASWGSATVGPTWIVDFLGVTAPAQCRCPEHQGHETCRIDLNALPAPSTGPKRYHHKSKIIRRFLDWRERVILDVGCREAPIGHLLAGRNYVIGVDLCPRNMLAGEPNALDKGYRELLIADAENLPIADGQADLVIATDVLEHAVCPEKLLAEFHRVLRPGGQLVVTVPNLVSYNNRLSILFGSGVGIELHLMLKGRSPVNPITGPRYPDQRQHLRFFTSRSLARLMASSGFAIVRRIGYDPVLSRIPLFDRLFRNWCQLAVVFGVRNG
jgi:SAM-dependent methyltransferase